MNDKSDGELTIPKDVIGEYLKSWALMDHELNGAVVDYETKDIDIIEQMKFRDVEYDDTEGMISGYYEHTFTERGEKLIAQTLTNPAEYAIVELTAYITVERPLNDANSRTLVDIEVVGRREK